MILQYGHGAQIVNEMQNGPRGLPKNKALIKYLSEPRRLSKKRFIAS